MIFTFKDIVSHYQNKLYPKIKQHDLIANKYKELFGKEITADQEIYVLLNEVTHFRPADRYAHIDSADEEYVERHVFSNRIGQLKKLKNYIKKLGVDKRSYMTMYDYENMVVAAIPSIAEKPEGLYINFQFPRVYIVLFEKEQYNFLRLAYEKTDDKLRIDPTDYLNLIFDFKLEFDSEGF